MGKMIKKYFVGEDYVEYLDLDDQTKKALRIKSRQDFFRKTQIAFTLLIILIISYFLFRKGIISHQAFELILSAFIGGYVGSALSYLVSKD